MTKLVILLIGTALLLTAGFATANTAFFIGGLAVAIVLVAELADSLIIILG